MENQFIKSIFEGYKAADNPNRRKKKQMYLFNEVDNTPFLFSSGYLEELYEKANKKEEYESILDHMYRHKATEVESYATIEKKIIDKYWR